MTAGSELLETAVERRTEKPSGRVSMRLWVLTNAPSPYQVELLNRVARQGDVELSLRFMRARSPAGQSVEAWADADLDARVMRGTLPDWCRDEFRLHPRAVWEVIRRRYHVHVLSGLYTSPTFLLCALAAVIFRRQFVLWLERPHPAIKWGRGAMRAMIDALKRRYLCWLLQHASQVWCIGSQAAREYQSMGVDEEAIRVLPYCCQTERFCVDAATSAAWRVRNELNGRFAFLYSGQLIHRKGIDTLLSAFAAVARRHPDAVLLMLGDGPLRNDYEAEAHELGLQDQVRFLGRQPQSELPEWFSVADVFVFPSRHDGWAVVINEACAAGLPVIASTQTGAAHDLIEEGVNGFVLDCEDVATWSNQMIWCLEHRGELLAMGAASRRMLEPFTSQAGAIRMTELAHEVIEQAPCVRKTAEAI